MKVYVDESIDDCFDCPCHNGENGNCKILNKFTDCVPKDCPLCSLFTHDQQIRADERKKVVGEIRNLIQTPFQELVDEVGTTIDIPKTRIFKILAQVEKGENNERN